MRVDEGVGRAMCRGERKSEGGWESRKSNVSRGEKEVRRRE